MSRRANIKLRGILEGDGSQGCLAAPRLDRASSPYHALVARLLKRQILILYEHANTRT